MTLTQLYAIVTGGASGLGREISRSILEAGGSVFVTDVNKETLDTTVSDFRSTYGEARVGGAQQNVTEEDSWKVVFNAAESHFKRPANCLVNNAGIGTNGTFYDDDLNKSHVSVANINFTAVLNGCQYALHKFKDLPEGQEGLIVNIASILGVIPYSMAPDYCGTKAALIHMTRAFESMKSQRNIRVTCVAPGFVKTPATRLVLKDDPTIGDPFGGFMEPEVLGKAFVASASDKENAGKTLIVLPEKRFYAKFTQPEDLFKQ